MILRRAAALLAASFGFVGLTPVAAGGLAQPAPSPVHEPLVVLIAVPGLQWSDVESMPTLRHFMATAAVGELSVKTAGDTTRCAAGILAATAGNRTTASIGGCQIPANDWLPLAAANSRSSYESTIGLLGTTLQDAGVRTISVGDDATPLLADERGAVTSAVSSLSAALDAAKSASHGAVIATLDSGLYEATATMSPNAGPGAVDRNLASTLSQLPSGATAIVAGISDRATGPAHLHVIAIRGPDVSHSELRSSAAGRAPYVQLIDLAPTILTMEHLAIPSAMVGRPMQQSGAGVASISRYVDDDRHAVGQRTLGQRTFLVLGITVITLMLLPLLPWSGARPIAKWLARLLAPAPALVFVMNALPWWRWGQPVYALLVVGGSVLIAAVTTLAARRGVTAAICVPLGFTFGALILDQLTGSHLQLSSPLGDNPIVAGRFSGVGNLDFAEIATAALLLAGVVGASLGGRRGVLAAVVTTALAVVVDGAPRLGNDIGGVLALVPGAILVTILVMGVRLTWRRALLALGAAVVVAIGVALAAYARPAGSQTHVGRFVGQILHGGAWTEVHRKLDSVFASFGLTVGTFVAGAAVVVAIVARRRIVEALGAFPGLRAGAIAVTVTAVLGVVLNDSGVTIAAMAVMVGLSAGYGAIGGREPPAAT